MLVGRLICNYDRAGRKANLQFRPCWLEGLSAILTMLVGRLICNFDRAGWKAKGPFKCYVMQWGWGCQLSLKKRYEGVQFNVISVTRGWVKFPGKKRYVTLEWPLMCSFHVCCIVSKDSGRYEHDVCITIITEHHRTST